MPRPELSCRPTDPWDPVGVVGWEGAVLAWQHLALRRNGQVKAHVRGAALYSEVRALSCMSCSLAPETGLGRHLAHLCPCTCRVPRPALGHLTPAGVKSWPHASLLCDFRQHLCSVSSSAKWRHDSIRLTASRCNSPWATEHAQYVITEGADPSRGFS